MTIILNKMETVVNCHGAGANAQSTSHSSTPLSFAQVCGSVPGKVKASPALR